MTVCATRRVEQNAPALTVAAVKDRLCETRYLGGAYSIK